MSSPNRSTSTLPVLASDFKSHRPLEFTLVKVGIDGQDFYTLSFIDHVITPVITGEGGIGHEAQSIQVERQIRTTVTVPKDFLEAIGRVALELESKTAAAKSE